MRVRLLLGSAALTVAALVLGGCAKFPANGASNNFTHLIFRMRYGAAINPHAVYVVAIRLIYADTEDQTLGPKPVFDVGSQNGFVTGSPTNYVQYDENAAELYTVNQFATQAQAPNPNDPNNPVNLASHVQTSVAYPTTNTLDPRPAGGVGSYSDTLGFEIDTQQLTLDSTTAQQVVAIQFNILSMTYPVGFGSTGDRVMDALGDQQASTLNDYVRIPLATSRTYYNKDRGTDAENVVHNPDTFSINGKTDPEVDLVDWSVEVRRP